MPVMRTKDFSWTCVSDELTQKLFFKFLVKSVKPTKSADRLICNSSNWLESETFASYPDILPIGPLLASNRLGKSTGHFWREDSGCLAWLDQQPQNSVIYVAFGSFTVFDHNQFQELALGLDLINRPFLWVVQQNITEDVHNAYRTDDNGIIRREEIKDKLERVLGEKGFKERVLDLQAKILDSVREGGSSDQNLHDFLAWIKE
ncbi:unnamed protein product [Fraxinus pennsylvanica]|uniref:Uncharacterized protein n=1 Tax=Fraxinus pennsylvanica TaxID=56036 RepID=A0AAD1ZXM0_9LAMI|nr:unnamed protein product [Fraxinus pennsylvanica]